MTIGFTGTRDGMTAGQRDQLDRWLGIFATYCRATGTMMWFHHGDARGADREAETVALRHLPADRIVRHPATPGKELARNREIVAASDALIAGPRGNKEELRSGTWATVRYARQAGKSVIMLTREETNRE